MWEEVWSGGRGKPRRIDERCTAQAPGGGGGKQWCWPQWYARHFAAAGGLTRAEPADGELDKQVVRSGHFAQLQ